MKLCLVCSSGGHFAALYSLRDFWKDYDRFWVTFFTSDNAALLSPERKYSSYQPTNRNIINLFRNFFLAVRLIIKERPDVIITSGAGVGVPFIYAGWLLRVKTVFIESMTRIDAISLSARLVYPVVDHLLVQWPELTKKYKKARFAGRIYDFHNRRD